MRIGITWIAMRCTTTATFTGAAAALRIVGTSSAIPFRLRNNVRCTNRAGIHYRYSNKESTQHCNNKTRQKNPSLSLVAFRKPGHCTKSYCHLHPTINTPSKTKLVFESVADFLADIAGENDLPPILGPVSLLVKPLFFVFRLLLFNIVSISSDLFVIRQRN